MQQDSSHVEAEFIGVVDEWQHCTNVELVGGIPLHSDNQDAVFAKPLPTYIL